MKSLIYLKIFQDRNQKVRVLNCGQTQGVCNHKAHLYHRRVQVKKMMKRRHPMNHHGSVVWRVMIAIIRKDIILQIHMNPKVIIMTEEKEKIIIVKVVIQIVATVYLKVNCNIKELGALIVINQAY